MRNKFPPRHKRHRGNINENIFCDIPEIPIYIDLLYSIYFFNKKSTKAIHYIGILLPSDYVHDITNKIISLDPSKSTIDDYNNIYELVRESRSRYTAFNSLTNKRSIDVNKIKNIYEQSINEYLNIKDNNNNLFEKKATFFQKRFGLSEIEKDLLSIIFTYFSLLEFSSTTNFVDNHFTNISTFFRFLSHLLNYPVSIVRSMLSSSGNLAKYGIIENICKHHSTIKVELPSIIEDYVNDVFTENDIIESFLSPGEKKENILEPLQSSSITTLIIIGQPSPGKTEHAKTISNTACQNEYFLKIDDLDKRNSFKFMFNLALSFLSENDVLIISEHDSILDFHKIHTILDLVCKYYCYY